MADEDVRNGCAPKTLKLKPTDRLHGKVTFDHGEILNKRFGVIRIKGEFPRIKPLFERDELTSEQLNFCISNLRTWVKSYFNLSRRPAFFENYYGTVVAFAAYMIPHGEIGSADAELALHLSFWLYYIDDFLEAAMEKKVSPQDTEKVTNQFLRLLTGEIFKFEKVEVFEDDAESLFTSLANIQQRFMLRTTEFKSLAGPFRFRLREYFNAIRWSSVQEVDGRYSVETFMHWRQNVSYFGTVAYGALMLRGIQIPTKVLKAISVRRLCDICDRAASFENDLLGIKKELTNGQMDNWVLFKVFEKGIPFDVAVDDECKLIETELTDFLYLREVVLQEFPNEPNVVKLIDALENVMDGHNCVYTHSCHYLTGGSVALFR